MTDRSLHHRLRHHWQLNPHVDFLNHGSFGAAPTVVLQAQRHWIEQLEQDPIEFLAPERSLLPRLDQIRGLIAELVHCLRHDLVFVRNATDGVNAVLRSFPFSSGDQVIITSHGYNACNNAVRYAAEQAGAEVIVADLPFPIESADEVVRIIQEALTHQTRLILVDHVTSPTGLVLPIKQVIDLAHRHDVRVMVDGAHAPGMVAVDLHDLDADYYTANHHKWLCGPKTSGFLYVRPEFQHEVRPTVISHGANTDGLGCSRFQSEFNWIGTYDPTPLLAMSAAIEFLNCIKPGGLTTWMNDNRALALAARHCMLERLDLSCPAPDEMIASLAAIPLPMIADRSRLQLQELQKHLFDHHRVEVPLFAMPGKTPCVRISAQAYNSIDQYERLADALRISCM